jgi:hypothetical protein
MWPMRTSTVFKSRWMALVWAAGVIWIAYDIAESAPRSSAPTNNVAADQPTNAASEILKGF